MSEARFEVVAHEITENLSLHFVKFIGKGATKDTFQVSKGGHDLALKIFDPQTYDPLRSVREIDALLRCNSQFIGKLYSFDYFKTIQGTRFFFSIEEFMGGGTLASKLVTSPFSLEETIRHALALTSALSHLKGLKLIHRDIKPENIMYRFGSPNPVLVDFGIVRDLSKVSITASWAPSGPCTPLYSAPEQLRNEKHLMDWRTDEFALGVVLSFCLMGDHPYREPGMNISEVIEAVANRTGPAINFPKTAEEKGAPWLVKMVHPWPIGRYASPEAVIVAVKGRS